MLQRDACERRVYRLATLLTGNPIAATKVIAQVVDVQPDLTHLDGAHLDRLTVLRSREITPAILADESVPRAAAETLAGMPVQQREAWVFGRVYRLDDREMARAMDCSVTATRRHLDQADAAMRQRLDSEDSAAAELVLAYSMSLDVPVFYREAKLRKRRLKVAAIAAVVVVGFLGLLAAAAWWLQRSGGG
jgi:hypothetical protein